MDIIPNDYVLARHYNVAEMSFIEESCDMPAKLLNYGPDAKMKLTIKLCEVSRCAMRDDALFVCNILA